MWMAEGSKGKGCAIRRRLKNLQTIILYYFFIPYVFYLHAIVTQQGTMAMCLLNNNFLILKYSKRYLHLPSLTLLLAHSN